MTPIDRSHTSSYSSSIVTMAVYCIVSEIKRDIGRKSRFLSITPREENVWYCFRDTTEQLVSSTHNSTATGVSLVARPVPVAQHRRTCPTACGWHQRSLLAAVFALLTPRHCECRRLVELPLATAPFRWLQRGRGTVYHQRFGHALRLRHFGWRPSLTVFVSHTADLIIIIIIIIINLTNLYKEWPVVYSCKEWIK